MKTLNKVMIIAAIASALLCSFYKISFIILFLMQMITFGLYVLSMSISDALNLKNASDQIVNSFNAKILKFKQKNIN